MSAAVDPGLLADFVVTGRTVRAPFATATSVVGDHLATVGDGPLAATRAALAELDHLLTTLADDEDDVEVIRLRVVGADRAGGCAPAPTPFTPEPTMVWADRHTDSWVVNLARGMTGQGLTPEFTRRLVDEGPGHAAATARSIDELSPIGHQRHLVTDPAGWLSDWRRAGRRGVGSAFEQAVTAVGVAASTLPGGDDLIDHLTGRRPGDELRASMLDLARGAVTDPDGVADAALGLSRFQDDPHLWLGDNAPDLVLQAARVFGGARPGRLTSADGRGGAGGAGDGPAPRLPDLRVQRLKEPEWAPTPPVASRRAGPLEPPQGWVAEINGEGMGVPGRSANCVDCARAVEANWRGDDAVAAPLADHRATGASIERLEAWSGGELRPATIGGIETELRTMGPGSSAIVASSWERGGAHVYNAVNDRGVVTWVDGQLGRVAPWPPPYAAEVDATLAIFFDGRGRRP